MKNVAISEGSAENKDSEVTRDVVLSWMREDIQQLRSWAKQRRISKRIRDRVYCLRSSLYGCSSYLQGLRDKELDDLRKDVEEIKQHIGMKT